MKTILLIFTTLIILIGSFNACTKTTIVNNYIDTVIVPIDPGIHGTSTINGDTTIVTIDGISIHYYSTSPCAPSTETFYFWVTSPSLPANTKLNWYYGDGNSSLNKDLDKQVANIYISSGFQTLQLQVLINSSLVTTITTGIKSWGQGVTPDPVSFSAQTYNVNDQNKVSFNANAVIPHGTIIRYQWDFNDGTTDSTAMPYHEHYFANVPKDMNYYVKLTAISSAGCKGTKTQLVNVPASYNLPCNFTYKNSNPCRPNVEQTTFTADTSGLPTGVKYFWDFKDGTTKTTNLDTIIHSYATKATLGVVLKILLNGRELCSNVQPVTVFGSKASLDVNISQVQKQGTNNFFFNSSNRVYDSYTVDKYSWDFGDGIIDSSNNPSASHIYSQSGTYNVSLKATISETGCSTTYTKYAIPIN